MKKLIILLIPILLISCKPQQLIKSYKAQMFDEAYLKCNNQIQANYLIKKLNKKESDKIIINRGCYKVYFPPFTNSYFYKCEKDIYLKVTFNDMNKTNKRGKIILKNKLRNSIIYNLD